MPTGIKTTYTYDEIGNLAREDFDVYHATHNILGSVSSIKLGNKSLVDYSYTEDTKQNLTQASYGNGQSISYSYNGDNLTSVKFDNDVSARFENQYDADGTLISRIDNVNHTIIEYGEDVTSIYNYKNNTKGSLIYKFVDSSDEDSAFDGSIETIEGQEFTIKQNENDTQFILPTDKTLTKAFSTAENGTLYTETFKLGSKTMFTQSSNPDNNDRVTQKTSTYSNGSIIQKYQYSKNNISEYEENGKTIQYVYDDNDQVIRVNDENSGKTWVYTYDTRGNLLTKKEYTYTTSSISDIPNDIVTYQYNNSEWADQLTYYNDNVITYDAIGNPLSYLSWNCVWEGGRQLKQLSRDDNTIQYQYDVEGLRTSKKVGNQTTQYIYNDSSLVYQTDGTNRLYFLYDETADLVGVQINGEIFVYVKDELGQIIGLVDETGALVVEYQYDAWGNILTVTGSKADTVGQLNPIRYKDYYYDTETGFYYLESRYYDPKVGRFLNADDPVLLLNHADANQYNLYAYGLNNPVNGKDPRGHFSLFAVQKSLELMAMIPAGIAAFCSIPEIRRAWNSFCSGIGTALNNVRNFPKKLQADHHNKLIAELQAVDNLSFSKIKKQKNKNYWIAIRQYATNYGPRGKVFSKRYSTFIPLYAISKRTAITYARNGGCIFARYKKQAYSVAKNASDYGKKIRPAETSCRNKEKREAGYFWHYHPNPERSIDGENSHIFYFYN